VLGVVAFALVATILVAGCGGKKKSAAPSTKTSGKTYSLLKVTWGDTDYFDPGLSYRLESWQVFQNVYNGLLTTKHAGGAAGTQIIPALATSLPKTNANGTDLTFTLRPNLKYSNGKPVKASDFAATIVRDFNMNSPGIGFYANIVGAAGCEKTPTNCKSISGIISNDSAGTVEIKLAKPEADFEYILTIPFSAPVPAGTPATPQTNPPPPANGPYYIASYKPHASFVVKRNPYYKNSIPTVPSGNPDEMDAKILNDLDASAQTVISGTSMYDESLLPKDRLAQIQKKYASQVRYYTCACTWYFFLNFRYPPFSSLQARQAVNYAIDRNQLVQIFGGLGKPTQNFLPPTYPQYKKITTYTHDLAKAKSLVKASGMAGTAVKVYAPTDDPGKSAGEYLQSVLNQIGFKASIREIGPGPYFTILGNQATKAQIGYTDWLQDYPYPTDWFNILLNGEVITPTHNNNYGDVDIKPLNSKIDQLKVTPPSSAFSTATNAAWAKLDYDYVVTNSAVVPYLNEIETDFFSSKMDASCDVDTNFNADWAQFCQK